MTVWTPIEPLSNSDGEVGSSKGAQIEPRLNPDWKIDGSIYVQLELKSDKLSLNMGHVEPNWSPVFEQSFSKVVQAKAKSAPKSNNRSSKLSPDWTSDCSIWAQIEQSDCSIWSQLGRSIVRFGCGFCFRLYHFRKRSFENRAPFRLNVAHTER